MKEKTLKIPNNSPIRNQKNKKIAKSKSANFDLIDNSFSSLLLSNHKQNNNFLFLKENLIFVKVLASSSFCKVNLYKNNLNNNITYYATKIYEKNNKSVNLNLIGNEIDNLNRLDSDSIIKLHKYYETDQSFYLIFEYFEGITLFEYFKKYKISEIEKINISHQIVQAVYYCHKEKISHRDIKLENILFNVKTNKIKLIDFGFSVYDTYKSELFCGSLSYMAPEILLKQEYNPFKADIWSLGITLYYIHNDKFPFNNTNLKPNKNLNNFSIKFSVDRLSIDCIDLLKLILNPQPITRPNIEDIMNHYYFIN